MNPDKKGSKLGLEMSLKSAIDELWAVEAESDRAMQIQINLGRKEGLNRGPERKCTFNINQFYSKENDLKTLTATKKLNNR
ncbi:MAG: hypothetical protein IH886_08365 [Nitrospinae bacterium]|nr:hypothetical protein [Nitrospinota bacterium]